MSKSHPVSDIIQLKCPTKQVINITLKQRISIDVANLQITKYLKHIKLFCFERSNNKTRLCV